MFPILDLIAAVGGLIIPPAYDFIKKKFLKSEIDTPEATAGALATTKPEVLPEYIKGVAELAKVKILEFNKDIPPGSAPLWEWVQNLRAAIRPLMTVVAIIALVFDGFTIQGMPHIVLSEGARATFELIASSWFGHRFTVK